MNPSRWIVWTAFAVCAGAGTVCAQPHTNPLIVSTADFATLEAQGTVIRTVRVNVGNVFDLDNPKENNRAFGWVNALHITTRPATVEAALLFRAGERISKQKIEETERLLREKSYLHDVTIRAVNIAEGQADIEVKTKDAWSLALGGSLSSAGGTKKSSIDLNEYNLFGTGMRLGLSRRSDSERKGNQVEIGTSKAFDGWTEVNALWSRFDDGSHRAVSMVRPFYALDTRWTAGINADRNDRIDTLYREGNTAAEYRHVSRVSGLFGGWSRGLVEGWATRWIAGVQMIDHDYAREPGRVAPLALPVDSRSRAPYVEAQWIEDRFVKLQNRNQIGRDEFLAMGTDARVTLGYAMGALGSSVSTLVGGAAISRGFAPGADQNLLASLQWDRRIGSTGDALDQFGAGFRWFVPQSPSWAHSRNGLLVIQEESASEYSVWRGTGRPDRLRRPSGRNQRPGSDVPKLDLAIPGSRRSSGCKGSAAEAPIGSITCTLQRQLLPRRIFASCCFQMACEQSQSVGGDFTSIESIGLNAPRAVMDSLEQQPNVLRDERSQE